MKPSDFKPQRIKVEIVMGYEFVPDPFIPNKQMRKGRQETATLQLLTKHVWEEIGFTVDDPVPPLLPDGKPDLDSMRYRTENLLAIHERHIRRLAHALAEGGDFEFETATLEEQAEELKTMDAGIFNALFTQLLNATNSFDTKVSTIADTFPGRNKNGKVSALSEEYSTP